MFAFVNEYGGGGYEDFGMPGQEPFNVIMYNTTGDEYRCVIVFLNIRLRLGSTTK